MRQSPGSNSPLVTRGSDQFPTYGLAVVVKKNSYEAPPLVVGIRFLPRLLNHGMGNWYEPLGELLFLSNAACLRVILNGLGHSLTKEKKELDTIYVVKWGIDRA